MSKDLLCPKGLWVVLAGGVGKRYRCAPCVDLRRDKFSLELVNNEPFF